MFKPHFTITTSILNKISEITEIKAKVESAKLLPAREVFLRRAAVIKMAHTSTSIEGNMLEEYQVKNIAEGKKVIAEADQLKEVENYLVALNSVDKLSDKESFTLEDVLEIHKVVINGLVDKGKEGKLRDDSVYIINTLPDGNKELAYSPPKAERVETLIKELLSWLDTQKETHPVIRAGIFHYQFETIHPFPDGNGRVGRLATLLHLYQSGWDFKKALVLEDYYNRDRGEYYKHLQTGETYDAREGVDLTGWLEYFVEGFLDEATQVKEQVLNLQVAGIEGDSRSTLSSDEIKIVEFVVSMGQITSSEVVDILEVPKRTAQAKLKKLEDSRILKKQGAGPGTYYVLANTGG